MSHSFYQTIVGVFFIIALLLMAWWLSRSVGTGPQRRLPGLRAVRTDCTLAEAVADPVNCGVCIGASLPSGTYTISQMKNNKVFYLASRKTSIEGSFPPGVVWISTDALSQDALQPTIWAYDSTAGTLTVSYGFYFAGSAWYVETTGGNVVCLYGPIVFKTPPSVTGWRLTVNGRILYNNNQQIVRPLQVGSFGQVAPVRVEPLTSMTASDTKWIITPVAPNPSTMRPPACNPDPSVAVC